MPFIGRLRLLPLLVLVSILSFSVRLMDVAGGVRSMDQALSVSANSEEIAAAANTEEVIIPSGLSEGEAIPLPDENWADPATLDMEFSDTQSAVLKELAERRKDLDARESRMNQREALLRVTEKQIADKTEELQILRTKIEELLGKQSEEEEARLQSLVKIYSGMKPKEAASIFNSLDMDILLQVVGRMSERKSAPILAAMETDKAKELTILLAEQKKLPELPE